MIPHREAVIRTWFEGVSQCMIATKGDIAAALAACLATQIFQSIEPMEKRCIFIVTMLEATRKGATPQFLFDHFMKKEESNHVWTPNSPNG